MKTEKELLSWIEAKLRNTFFDDYKITPLEDRLWFSVVIINWEIKNKCYVLLEPITQSRFETFINNQ